MNRPRASREWLVADARQRLTGRSELAQALGVPHLMASLLQLRGVETPEQGKRFLNPSIDHLSDPFLLSDMERAVARLQEAKERRERALVFGDYDVDGIAGAVILIEALGRFGIAECRYGMPNRLTEGYGLTADRVDWAQDLGARVIVTVDNGANAHDAAARAKALGIDLIVTDHHPFETDLPDAFAVINPKRENSGHPMRDACGAVVAMKLAWALGGEKVGLDLAALGTVADIVPLLGENRDIVAIGIREMIERPRPGILKLARVAGTQLDELNTEKIAFQLAPRINAGGRMGDGTTGLELLLCQSVTDAGPLARELDEANAKRREKENGIVEQVHKELEDTFRPEQRGIVLARDDWHSGVLGIVASRVQATHYRPVVLVGYNEDGFGRGSARSISGFDIAKALSACREHLVTCGGHHAAAGLTLRRDQFETFREAFEAECRKSLPAGELRQQLRVDAVVSLGENDSRLVKMLERLQPFGHGNPAPVFCTYGAGLVPESCRSFGDHIRLMVHSGSATLNAVGFRMGALFNDLKAAKRVDIAYTPQLNRYAGVDEIQLVLRDVLWE